MRKSKASANAKNSFSILTLDDDAIMTSTLQAYFQRSGYRVDTENDPYQAIERVREGKYDILLLDFLMTPICGDQVVEEIRKFNKELFIILLTGHKSMAPPIKTIRELDIQGYYEKSERFDQLELLVESCCKSILQMRTIKSYQNGLAAIMDSLPQIYHLQSLEQIADSILQAATGLMGTVSGFLALDPAYYQQEHARGGQNFITRTRGQHAWPDVESLLSEEALSDGHALVEEGGSLIVPILDERRRPIGLVGVALPAPPKADQVQLLQVFAKQASAAIRNILLHSLVNAKNEELTGAYRTLRDSYMEIVSAMRLLVDARNIYTRGHSDRVSDWAEKIARAIGMDEAQCERVRVAGLFHDIGKIGVSDGILLKPGRLTEDEYAVMKGHSAEGAKVLEAISLFHDIVPIVRAHHERMDGQGYPDGLRGEQIPIEARIITVADSYDAMTSDRQYRENLGYEAAVQELIRGKGSQFDAQLVDAFIRILEQERERVS